jgi:hypothetical protein
MNRHTYLRAYMAGITVPTVVLLAAATAFCFWRYVYNFPAPIERVIIFPMAVVPNLWGLWNILYVAVRERTHLSIGFHGALLPLLLGPLGILMTHILDFSIPHIDVRFFPIVAPIALIAYYLAWKYLVGFLNGVLGIA